MKKVTVENMDRMDWQLTFRDCEEQLTMDGIPPLTPLQEAQNPEQLSMTA